MQKILKNFKNKRVIITGHTGFKGSWLSLWLHMSGAKIMGISNGVLTSALVSLLDNTLIT